MEPPEQIARRLRAEFPDDESMQISHEAIYRIPLRAGPRCAAPGAGRLPAHRPGAAQTPPPRRRPPNRTKDKVMISEHPAEVRRPGGSRTLEGRPGGRQERPDRSREPSVRADRPVEVLAVPAPARWVRCRRRPTTPSPTRSPTLPAALRRSLTWDRPWRCTGTPNSPIAADLPVYFCGPPLHPGNEAATKTQTACSTNAQRHRPLGARRHRPRRHRPTGAQRPPPQDPRLSSTPSRCLDRLLSDDQLTGVATTSSTPPAGAPAHRRPGGPRPRKTDRRCRSSW